MSINGSSIPVGATYTPSGGSATTLKTKTVDDKKHVVFLDDGNDLINQTTLEFTSKAPHVSTGAPNGYTQARNTVLIKQPFVLDNGNITVITAKVDVAVDFELTAAEKLSFRELMAHVILDSDYLEYWDDQSMA